MRSQLSTLTLALSAAAAPAAEAPRLFEHWRAAPVQATASPGCEDGVQPSGALYRICQPLLVPWNGELVLYAHGYTAPAAPLSIPEEADLLGPFFTLPGRAFAVTSFRSNGLAVLDAVADLGELLELYAARYGSPARVWLVGASQGGLVAALALERRPELYTGALVMCAPAGSFAAQVDYFGDFRVVFDALFPGRLPPSAVSIPPELIATWSDVYANVVRPALEDPAAQTRTLDLLLASAAAFDPAVPATREQTASGLLWYNVFATNEAAGRLGGQPYENTTRIYAGSSRDAELNASATRYAADPSARGALAGFETSGAAAGPVVTIHTTADEIVPYAQSLLYGEKLTAAGARHEHVPIERYGHCNFEPLELVAAFERLVALGR